MSNWDESDLIAELRAERDAAAEYVNMAKRYQEQLDEALVLLRWYARPHDSRGPASPKCRSCAGTGKYHSSRPFANPPDCACTTWAAQEVRSEFEEDGGDKARAFLAAHATPPPAQPQTPARSPRTSDTGGTDQEGA